MSKAFDYLREFGVFYLATNNAGAAAVRPFGAVSEKDGKLYIATGNFKEVYKQLGADGNVVLAATKAGTLTWLRVYGKAVETKELADKEAMLAACPVLVRIFKEATNPVFAVFAIEVTKAELHKDDGTVEIL